MTLKRVLPFAKDLLKEVVQEGDTAIDATAGNGHDTFFLVQLVGETGHVFAFDVQEDALTKTAERLGNNRDRATLIHDGHEHVLKYVSREISAAIFNLGYLPGSDHSVVTKGETTITAIQGILDRLKIGGLIVLVVYHGHEGGKEERDDIMDYVSTLPQSQVDVMKYEFLNQKNSPPFIIAIEKKKEM
ncbi:class I SAM-dependent methyltransferase [Chungangia koreensis]|uniref:Class I SAM-dependent methyltransferase n=1 Tax=Chungangia koreensis TaxID=752657 RepID=A0ABV8X1T8_9LACT